RCVTSLFHVFFFFLFFGLIRKWTVVESQVIQISFQFRTLNHTYVSEAAALLSLGSSAGQTAFLLCK
ncbi:mCG1027598, partial [Mus musculus]